MIKAPIHFPQVESLAFPHWTTFFLTLSLSRFLSLSPSHINFNSISLSLAYSNSLPLSQTPTYTLISLSHLPTLSPPLSSSPVPLSHMLSPTPCTSLFIFLTFHSLSSFSLSFLPSHHSTLISSNSLAHSLLSLSPLSSPSPLPLISPSLLSLPQKFVTWTSLAHLAMNHVNLKIWA